VAFSRDGKLLARRAGTARSGCGTPSPARDRPAGGGRRRFGDVLAAWRSRGRRTWRGAETTWSLLGRGNRATCPVAGCGGPVAGDSLRTGHGPARPTARWRLRAKRRSADVAEAARVHLHRAISAPVTAFHADVPSRPGRATDCLGARSHGVTACVAVSVARGGRGPLHSSALRSSPASPRQPPARTPPPATRRWPSSGRSGAAGHWYSRAVHRGRGRMSCRPAERHARGSRARGHTRCCCPGARPELDGPSRSGGQGRPSGERTGTRGRAGQLARFDPALHSTPWVGARWRSTGVLRKARAVTRWWPRRKTALEADATLRHGGPAGANSPQDGGSRGERLSRRGRFRDDARFRPGGGGGAGARRGAPRGAARFGFSVRRGGGADGGRSPPPGPRLDATGGSSTSSGETADELSNIVCGARRAVRPCGTRRSSAHHGNMPKACSPMASHRFPPGGPVFE